MLLRCLPCINACRHNRYLRFFSVGAALGGEVRQLTRSPDDEHLALLVQAGEVAAAAGSYERVNAARAGFALIVDGRAPR